MTQEQLARIATRALAIYLVVWAVSDVIELPRSAMTLVHYLQDARFPREGMPARVEDSVVYYLRYSVMVLAAYVLRIALWLMGARWLYRCGPWLQRFFGLTDQPAGASPAA